MGYLDDIKAITVRVGTGSGVLISPLSDSYHYILTAYHVIENDIDGVIEISFEHNSPYYGVEIEKSKPIVCKEHDAAIIPIKRLQAEAHFVGTLETLPSDEKRWHVGYPNNQNATGKAERCVEHEIRNWLGKYGGAFEEYQCEQTVQNNEIDGMSGGGIFDGNYHLIGIHKQTAADENKEQLSKFVMIPWACYQKLLDENHLPGVPPYDLSSFSFIKTRIFNFDNNRGAKKKLQSFLVALAPMKSEIENLSPVAAYEAFQKSREALDYVKSHLLNENDWVIFGEFLVAAGLLADIKPQGQLEELFPKFQFVQAEHDFDIFDVDENMDPKVLGKVSSKNVVFVVGGVSSKRFFQDVRPGNVFRINRVAQTDGKFDIAKLGKDVFSRITFVNGNLFKDAMLENTKNLEDAADEDMALYKQLLNSQIWPMSNSI